MFIYVTIEMSLFNFALDFQNCPTLGFHEINLEDVYSVGSEGPEARKSKALTRLTSTHTPSHFPRTLGPLGMAHCGGRGNATFYELPSALMSQATLQQQLPPPPSPSPPPSLHHHETKPRLLQRGLCLVPFENMSLQPRQAQNLISHILNNES